MRSATKLYVLGLKSLPWHWRSFWLRDLSAFQAITEAFRATKMEDPTAQLITLIVFFAAYSYYIKEDAPGVGAFYRSFFGIWQ